MTPGSNLKAEFLKALGRVAGHREPSGREKGLLSFLDIAEKKLGTEIEAFVSSQELVDACMHDTDDLVWVDSPVKLKNFLKNFDLAPDRNSNRTKRGYVLKKQWVEDWKERYPKPPETDAKDE
jgi:hypothetical protein